MLELQPDGLVTRRDDPLAIRDELPRPYLTLLAGAAEQLLGAGDPARMVDRLFAMIDDELRLDVFLNYRAEGDRLVLEAHGGLDERQAADGDMLMMGQAVCGMVARNRCRMHATGIQSSRDPSLDFLRTIGLDAYACMPLIHGGELLGTLGFGRRWTGRFDDHELSLLHTLCCYVAIAKHRLRTEAALRDGIERQERLLQELNHRVRNALQLAIGIVGMEFRLPGTDTADAAKRRAVARLEVMATAHQPLYRSDRLDEVDIATLAAAVAEQTTGRMMTVATDDGHVMPVERAVALALVLHAVLLDMPDLRAIALARRMAGGPAQLALTLSGGSVRDQPDGDGDGALPRSVSLLLRQLRGTLDRDGSTITIRFTEQRA